MQSENLIPSDLSVAALGLLEEEPEEPDEEPQAATATTQPATASPVVRKRVLCLDMLAPRII
jgi:hypothetical protein